MQSTQNLAWADNAIKLAVDMTVAAINRVNLQGSAEDQAKQVRSVMATVFPEAVTLVREARQGLSTGSTRSSVDASASWVPGAAHGVEAPRESVIGLRPAAAAPPASGAALCDDLLEGADVEDEDEFEAHAEGECGDRDLLPDRVGGHRRAGGGAREDLDEQRLLHPGPARCERHGRGHDVDAEHEQDVAYRAADVEGLQQQEERREAEQPADELDGEDLAEVAPPVEEDRQPRRTRSQKLRTRADSSAKAASVAIPAAP